MAEDRSKDSGATDTGPGDPSEEPAAKPTKKSSWLESFMSKHETDDGDQESGSGLQAAHKPPSIELEAAGAQAAAAASPGARALEQQALSMLELEEPGSSAEAEADEAAATAPPDDIDDFLELEPAAAVTHEPGADEPPTKPGAGTLDAGIVIEVETEFEEPKTAIWDKRPTGEHPPVQLSSSQLTLPDEPAASAEWAHDEPTPTRTRRPSSELGGTEELPPTAETETADWATAPVTDVELTSEADSTFVDAQASDLDQTSRSIDAIDAVDMPVLLHDGERAKPGPVDIELAEPEGLAAGDEEIPIEAEDEITIEPDEEPVHAPPPLPPARRQEAAPEEQAAPPPPAQAPAEPAPPVDAEAAAAATPEETAAPPVAAAAEAPAEAPAAPSEEGPAGGRLPTMEIEPLVEATPPPAPEEPAEEPAPDVIEQARALAVEDDPHLAEETLTRELDADPDRLRKALIQYELGHLLQSRLDAEPRAVKAYAQALNLDPLLRPNVWAIRRIFVARQLWPNLLKLQDAEVRFEEEPARKAEVLLEKGWIQQDQLKDAGGATESFWAAHDVNTRWLAPLLALEKVALAGGDLTMLADIYRKMVAATEDAGRRATLLLELARLEEKRAGGSPQEALQILDEAYAIAQDRMGVLELMEQIALGAGMHRELTDILRREADELLRREDPAARRLAAAKLRLGAQIARDTLDDAALAQSLLSAALDAQPDEVLLLRELLELAEDREDWRLAASLIERRLEGASPGMERANLWHRLGLARLAASDERATEAFDRSRQEVPGFLPVMIAEERRLMMAGDLEPLARLWVAEAEAALQTSPGLPLAGASDPAWCASALWRAASLMQRLNRPAEAVDLCRRALGVCPTCEAARDDMEQLLRRAGEHAQLAALLEEQLTLAAPEEAQLILESLLALYAGPLGDLDRQLDTVRRLLKQGASVERRLQRLEAYLLERMGRQEELEGALRGLEGSEQDDRQLAAWKLTRARLLEGPLGKPDEAIAVYQDVLERQPDHAFAFAGLENLLRRLSRGEELCALLRRAADQCPETDEGRPRKITLLRRLAAQKERVLQKPEEAMAVYAEVVAVQPRDRVSLRDLARSAGTAGDAAKLAEALEGMVEVAGSSSEKTRLLVRLAEILDDQLSDPLRAEELLTRALESAPDAAAVPDVLDALVRRRMIRGDTADALRSMEALQEVLPPDAAMAVLEERAWLSGGPAGEADRAKQLWAQVLERDASNRRALLARVRLAARERDAASLSDAHVQLALLSEDPAATLAFELRAGTLGEAAGDPLAGAEAYGRALKQSPGALEAICGLLARPGLGLDERADLLAQLAAVAPDRVREDMRLHRAEVCERAGRLRDAVEELAPVLEKDPDNLPALFLAQRLAEATGNRDQEARCWTRLGQLLSDDAGKSEALGKAADLLLALSRVDEAIGLLRRVLSLQPKDAAAYQKLHDLYRERNDDRGLDELLGHRIRHADDVGKSITLHMDRAELRLQRRSDKPGAVRELLAVLRLDPRHLEALRQLSKLYDEDGNAVRALELYKRYLELVEVVSIRRPAVLRVAELLVGLGRTGEAIDICRRFLDQAPDDEDILTIVTDLYIKTRDFPHAVSMLERLGSLRQDPEWRAQHLRRMGMLYWQDIKDLREARTTLLRARDLAPTDMEVLGALRQLGRQMGATEELKQVLERAKDDVREALMAEPHSVELYRKLMHVSEWDEDEYALLAAMGALCALGAADREDRELYGRRVAKISFEPKRQVAAKAWRDALIEPGAKNAYADIWAQIAEAVPRLFEGRVIDDPARVGAQRSGKVDRKSGGASFATLDRMAAAFGITDYDLYRANDPELIAGLAGERPALVVGSSVVSSLNPSRRFRLGRLFSLMRERAVGLDVLTQNELELLLAGAVYTVQPGASFALPPTQVETEAKRLGKALSRRARKALPLAVNRLMSEGGDVEAWAQGVLTTADRAGLLVCGDVLVALDEMVPEIAAARPSGAPAEILEILKRHPQAARVMAFSVGRDYLNLRRELQV